MNRRDALKSMVVSGSSLLVLNEVLTGTVRGNGKLLSTLTINIDSTRFGALKNVNGTVQITDAVAPGIQSGLQGNYPLALVRVDQTTVSALETYCMHQGCQVNTYDGSKFLCGCHGSQYTATGAIQKGPTMAPLKSYPTTLAGSILTVSNLPGNESWNLTAAEDLSGPTAFNLHQNYPNPFGPGSASGSGATQITYILGAQMPVSLMVFDAAGGLIATLVEAMQEEGVHMVNFDARHLAAGTYFYTIRAGGYVESKRMQLLR